MDLTYNLATDTELQPGYMNPTSILQFPQRKYGISFC